MAYRPPRKVSGLRLPSLSNFNRFFLALLLLMLHPPQFYGIGLVYSNSGKKTVITGLLLDSAGSKSSITAEMLLVDQFYLKMYTSYRTGGMRSGRTKQRISQI